MTPKIIAIAATTLENVIAVNDRLPLHSPRDMAFFKEMTTGHHVIMGRKTFDTLPTPLPDRRNIVVTRGKLNTDPAVYYTSSYINAFRNISVEDTRNVFIIGGAQIYRDLIPMCDELYLTIFGTNLELNPTDKITSFPYNVTDLERIFSKTAVIEDFIENDIPVSIVHFTKE